MLCHFSIMTQLHPRLHQIPQGKQLKGRRTDLASDEESLVAGHVAGALALPTSSDLSGTESRVLGK